MGAFFNSVAGSQRQNQIVLSSQNTKKQIDTYIVSPWLTPNANITQKTLIRSRMARVFENHLKWQSKKNQLQTMQTTSSNRQLCTLWYSWQTHVQHVWVDGTKSARFDSTLWVQIEKNASLARKENNKRCPIWLGVFTLKMQYYPHWFKTWEYHDQVRGLWRTTTYRSAFSI